jgi:hypothetical protein
MRPLKINAKWDNEASVWVATSDDVIGLAIEASTMDALIERLKLIIPELIELNHQDMAGNELPFALNGFFANAARLNQDTPQMPLYNRLG